MSDINPETEYSEYAADEGPSSPDAAQEREHPEQEAHGGSMAPGLVDDAGNQVEEAPPAPAT
ncbi:hypothetical protein AB0J83_30505 [Actinoplanes sp. NPDC049596]|uniref:hypothetical protein n=1 Tax=unclassified Actinoplanes TaxID=2626549 RepID=UPI0034324273